MANPLPSLSAQPADILRLLSRQLELSDHAAFAQVSRSLTPVQTSLQKRRLELQRLQWERLFPGRFGNDFEANEELLRLIGLRTIPLTAPEEAALRAAWSSLNLPPPELNTDQKRQLTGRYLPVYSEQMAYDLVANPVPFSRGREVGFEELPAVKAYSYRWELMNKLFLNRDRRQDYGQQFRETVSTFHAQNLTQVALLKAVFQSVLRIFSRDGERYQRRTSAQPNAPLVDEQQPPMGNAVHQTEIDLINLAVTRIVGHRRSKSGTLQQEQDGTFERGCLLLLIIAAGRPVPENSFCMKMDLASAFPAITQILSVTGYNFLQVPPSLPNSSIKMSYLGQCTLAESRSTTVSMNTAISLTIVVDRLLVQGQLNGECLERIKNFLDHLSAPNCVYDRDGSIQQHIREHLTDRQITLPDEAPPQE